MFTSRAEFRLSLREDNAAERMPAHAERTGLVDTAHVECLKRRAANIHEGIAVMNSTRVKPGQATEEGAGVQRQGCACPACQAPERVMGFLVALDPTDRLATFPGRRQGQS